MSGHFCCVIIGSGCNFSLFLNYDLHHAAGFFF
jgi:hypothetical protein